MGQTRAQRLGEFADNFEYYYCNEFCFTTPLPEAVNPIFAVCLQQTPWRAYDKCMRIKNHCNVQSVAPHGSYPTPYVIYRVDLLWFMCRLRHTRLDFLSHSGEYCRSHPKGSGAGVAPVLSCTKPTPLLRLTISGTYRKRVSPSNNHLFWSH